MISFTIKIVYYLSILKYVFCKLKSILDMSKLWAENSHGGISNLESRLNAQVTASPNLMVKTPKIIILVPTSWI